jgi:predicted MFS family arabinose efflux permease
MIGSFIVAMVPFAYLFADTSSHVYIIQALYGTGLAFALPPWYAIFTRHIDKMQENFDWSLDSVSIGIAGATAAALGGILADKFGFSFVFILGGVFSVLAALVQLRIFRDLKAKVAAGQVQPAPPERMP